MYFWCRDNIKQDELQFQLDIVGANTMIDWKNFCHDICLEYFIRNPAVIGRPGHTVKIDECLLVCRKYNVGHRVSEQWVFAGYDVEEKVGFMVPVAKQKHKQRFGTHRELIDTYLAEFMWRKRFGHSFHDFIAQIRPVYPL